MFYLYGARDPSQRVWTGPSVRIRVEPCFFSFCGSSTTLYIYIYIYNKYIYVYSAS